MQLATPPQQFADAREAQHWQQQQASDTLLLLRTLQQAQFLRQRSVEEPGAAAVPWLPHELLNDWKGNLTSAGALPTLVSGSGFSSTGTADTQLPTPFADPVRQAVAAQGGYANGGAASPLGSAASLEGAPPGGWAPPAGLLPVQRSSGPGLTREQLAAVAAQVQQQPVVDDGGGSAAQQSVTRHSSLGIPEGTPCNDELDATLGMAGLGAGQSAWVAGWPTGHRREVSWGASHISG